MTDLSHKRYYFELTTSPNVIWADLAKFKLTAGAGASVMVLNPDNIKLSRNVSGKFKKAAKAGRAHVFRARHFNARIR